MADASPGPAVIPRKPVLLFAAHALVLALLIGYWPSARAVYPASFRAQAEWVFGGGEPLRIGLREATGRHLAEKDSFVEAFRAEDPEPAWRLSVSALRFGYWPSAVLLAMLLATPMTARRRWLAVGVGLLWLHVFALARLGIEILRADAELALGGVDPGGRLLVYRTLSEVLNSNIVVIAAVFLGWVALAAPRRALEMGWLARVLGGGPRVP